MVGWILIEDTNIDYPVMQTPTDPTYYLKHDFEKNYTDYGCPFMQADCDALAPSDNLILYGHNMKDGSMFADLAKYRSKDFWQSHKTVWFDTALGSCAYEIFAVIHTTVQADTADAFPFYRFVDAKRGRCTIQAFRLSTATSCSRFPPATTLPITADCL